MKQIRIAIIGSPGSGKSTLAAGLFYFMKIKGLKVELVPELIKTKLFEGADFSEDGFDVSNTLKQKKFERIFLESKEIDYVIAEAPLCNGYFYSSFYKKEAESAILKKIALENINNYDYLIFVKRRPNQDYISFGRKEDSNTSINLEKHIINEIRNLNFKGKVLSTINIEEIINKIIL